MNLNDLFILRKDKQISILTVLYVPQSEESSQHLCHGMPRRFSLLDVQLISHISLIGARQDECLVVNIFLSVLSSVYQLLNRVATNDKFVIKNQNMKITNVNFISLPDRYILQLLRTQEKLNQKKQYSIPSIHFQIFRNYVLCLSFLVSLTSFVSLPPSP